MRQEREDDVRVVATGQTGGSGVKALITGLIGMLVMLAFAAVILLR